MAQDKASPGDKGRGNRQRSGGVQAGGKAAPLDSNEGGFFVDAAPSERVQRPSLDVGSEKAVKGSGRAADRRREQGKAPEPQGPKDTRTSLKEPAPREPRQTAAKTPTAFASLACVKGPETGQVLPLVDGSFTVGRARENALVLKDIAASRKHLRLEVEGGRVRMIDLGSGNGTKVNGKRAAEVELRHGDTIEIGSSLLMFAEAGKAPPPPDQSHDDAQARVVAAADELAKELSAKMRFGEGGFDDGFVAKTRALKTADARAVAEQIQREAQQAQQQQQPAPKKSNDKLWNETFTNMPLSAVVATDQALQGGGARDARDVPQTDQLRRPNRPPPVQVPPRSMAPQGVSAPLPPDESSLPQEYSETPRRGSFITSVLLSAGVVVVVGALGLGVWALFFKDENKPVREQDTVAAEREAEYAVAISRAQDAYARQDWAAVRDYATAALQTKPNDVMSTTYKRDAELKLQAAQQAPPPPPPPPTNPPPTANPTTPTTTPTANPPANPTPPVQATPVEKPAPPPPPPPPVEKVVEKPKPAPVAVAKPKPAPPKPTPKPKGKGMSESDAQAQFERAIDAFRSKDNPTACALLDKVADRAPADSVWKGKAESLFLKKCGN